MKDISMENEAKHSMKYIGKVIDKLLSQSIEMKLKLRKEKIYEILSKKRQLQTKST